MFGQLVFVFREEAEQGAGDVARDNLFALDDAGRSALQTAK